MDLVTQRAAVRRFPLVGRGRPACPSLPERVREIADIAEAAARTGTDVLHEAAHALNKAALLASDCGLPDLARNLCWQHINVYRQAGHPLSIRQAGYMLEPVLNLARLQLRADDGQHALRLLDSMYQAVMNRADLVIENRTLPLANLTGSPRERQKLREWVWQQYIADGIRALVLADRWPEAVTHATAHRGIGLHLMDGRQTEIIAHCLRGAPQTARSLLEASTITEPWEQQVAACLRVMCTEPSSTAPDQDVTSMVVQFLADKPKPGYAVFRARLGLTVATLAADVDPGMASLVHDHAATEVLTSGDGYAARDILTNRHPLEGVSGGRRQALARLVESAGLGSKRLPAPLLDSFTCSAKAASEALTATM
ncbi:hypothetical protein [Nonomuraea sp. NPDC052265]|uniref:hypothetical protein n=1 Tax=Nonomuraea sp. NPDC052265 TaxID=3364374 RepID=UPI0037CAAE71